MREAPVGWQCSSCVHADARRSPVTRRSPVIRWRGGSPASAWGSGPGAAPAPRGTGRLGNSRITPAAIALIIANVVVYSYERNHPAFELKYSLVPSWVRYDGRWYELITSAFLHANFTHILLNMFSLFIIGPPVEREVGRVRFLFLYFISALGGSVGFYLLAPANEAGLGASGAIFGLFGAYFVIAKLRGWPTQQIIVLLVINGLYSFSGGIAWQDHLGGLIAGSLAAFGMLWTRGRGGYRVRASDTAQLVQGAAVVLAAAVVFGLLLQLPPGHVNA